MQSRLGRDLTLPEKAVVSWTSDKTSGGKTFYSLVNEVIREDQEGTLLDLSARFCRALSCHLVLRNDPVAFNEVQWPPEVFRGTWMPAKQVRWFHERHRRSEYFRSVQLVASSDNRTVANRFLNLGSYKSALGYVPVRFEISLGLDSDSHPLHVRLLENITAEQGEREWLFPAYSSFQVEAPAAAPACMTVPACPDAVLLLATHFFVWRHFHSLC